MERPNERRKKPRVDADLALRFDLSGQSGLARIRDISAAGVRCVTDRQVPLMTQVGLVIVLPDVLPGGAGGREIACRGAVVRSRSITTAGERGAGGAAFETAIFFTEMRDADRTEVEEFVSAIARSSGR